MTERKKKIKEVEKPIDAVVEVKNKGYARVSTVDQNLDRQIISITEQGVKEEDIYQEKKSGKTMKDRPELLRMLNELQPGETVFVSELTRLGRSTIELIDIINKIGEKGAHIKSLKEPWLDTTTPHGRLLITMFAGLAQFERETIVERTKEGMQAAKLSGKHVGRAGQPDYKKKHAIELYNSGSYSSQQIADMCGMSRATLYRVLAEEGITQK
jgi:DNA invertase Pin-like site-specific DNA recombinase